MAFGSPQPRKSNGFHRTCSSRHSNQFATKPLFLILVVLLETSTSLGDQGSQVRVLSPRRTRNLSSRGRAGEVCWAPARPGV